MKTPQQLRQWVREREKSRKNPVFTLDQVNDIVRRLSMENSKRKAAQDHWQKHVAPHQTGGLKSEHIMLVSVCIAVLGIAYIIIGALA